MAVPAREQRIVAQRSGNRCAICKRLLTAEGGVAGRDVILGEIAHIVAERPSGPRGNSELTMAERNSQDNLLLLCSEHHQLVDSEPHKYTVERLLAMKADHEQWVERTLGLGEAPLPEAIPFVAETVHSTMLAVEHMPRYVFGSPCVGTDEKQVLSLMTRPPKGVLAPFIVRDSMLWSFVNLQSEDSPFAPVMRNEAVERFRADEWWSNPDQLRWYVELLNRCLNKLTGRKGLRLDKRHRRYYFAPESPGQPLSVTYRGLNRQATRSVVWEPISKATGVGRGYWYHRAVSLRFLKIDVARWCLAIRPELMVTRDGKTPLDPAEVGRRVTRRTSRVFNYDLLGEVNFWRDYLSDSRPRILFRFGEPGQFMLIPTTLMRGDVSWPGIPEEHAKAFENIEYADDLFSWAETNELYGAEEDSEEAEAWDEPEDLAEDKEDDPL